MNTILTDPITVGSLIIAVIGLFIFQIIILFKIKMILQQISFYVESISRFFYRFTLSTTRTNQHESIPRTCQFCKYRLSFIHMSDNKGEVENFYYKCQLRNVEVNLDDSCEQFEKDDIYQ